MRIEAEPDDPERPEFTVTVKLLLQNCKNDRSFHSVYDLYVFFIMFSTFEPMRQKSNNLGFRRGPTQTGMYSHRCLEAGNFGFRK